MEEKNKTKSVKKSLLIGLFIGIAFLIMSFLYGMQEMIEIKYIIIMAGIIGAGFSILNYFNILKSKSKEKREEEKQKKKRLKDYLKGFKTEELKESMNEFSEIQEALKKEYGKRKDRIKEDDSNFGMRFAEGGILVFFVAILFFGAMDGTFFQRDNYAEIINNTFTTAHNSLSNAMLIVTDGLGYLFIKLYEIGMSKPKTFFWLWVVVIIFWIGYYIYEMLKKSYEVNKWIYNNFIKKIIQEIKSGRLKNENKI